MARRTEDSLNWGGRRPRAGRPRQYNFIKLPVPQGECSEREQLTPESDLSVCIAEMEADEGDTRRGIYVGDIWYGAKEAQAIADFVKRYQDWLKV